MRNDPDVRRAADIYQLGLLRTPASGRAGELLGRGTGSSLEFQEYREYTPGDDIRHLDWAAYGRSDTLMVRLYREEISPRTEILCDASRSMSVTGPSQPTTHDEVVPPKVDLARKLTGLFALLASGLGGSPAVIPLDDSHPLERLGFDQLDQLASLPFEARATLADQLAAGHVPLQSRSVRIVISDFLFPHDPEVLVKRLASDASTLWVIQVLGEWEADPTPLGGRRLVDQETSAEADLLLNRHTIDEYRGRLRRLQRGLAQACRRAEATYVSVVAEAGLEQVCRDELCVSGILRIA